MFFRVWAWYHHEVTANVEVPIPEETRAVVEAIADALETDSRQVLDEFVSVRVSYRREVGSDE